MASSDSNAELVMELAEEFLERYRKGERPPLKEYMDRHPELAAEIKEVFPAMAMMENIAVVDESLEGGKPAEVSKTSAALLQQLGDYRIIREIGRGGMGVVYEAEQVSLGRHVAVKVLPNQALQDAKHKGRFEREAKAAAKLHHTNIVPVFGVGENDGLPYYVMQFIQGLGLDAVLDELNRIQPGAAPTPTGLPTAGEIRIARRDVSAADMARSLITGKFDEAPDDEAVKPDPQLTLGATTDPRGGDSPPERSPSLAKSGSRRLSDPFTISSSSITLPGTSGTGQKAAAKTKTYGQSVANIGRQVAEALEYAHKQGILHRDIKPSNLLLDLRGTVWVTDFGLAKVAGPDAENLTHTGDILGTLRYMPPEAFEGKSDARGDVYSLGLTLYELLAMRPAFDQKDRNKLIKQVTTGEPLALDKVSREAPRDLVTIVHKAIDRDPRRRYATAEELASDLQRFLDDEPILARRQTHLERYVRWARHNPGIAVLGAVLTAVLVLVTLGALIVAGHMSTLADKEAQAADHERTARQDAEEAKNREANEKSHAEQAKMAADASRRRAEQALTKAEENFAKARSAVNDYLTAVSEDERLKAPGLQGLRIQLLQSALQFYQDFLKERGNDPTLKRELAGVYYKVGEIYRDLGQSAASQQSYARARRLYEPLAAEAPKDPDFQHSLAMALNWTGAQAQAIVILEKLIHPEDPRYHADLGNLYNQAAIDSDKTDKAKALEFLRKSLTVRERLVRLKPDDPDARLGLSGSLNNIAIHLNKDGNTEALALLQRAVEQCETAYRLRPAHTLTARYLTTQLSNVSDHAKRAGDTELVLAAHRRRVEVLDRRARDNPRIVGFDAQLVDGYARLLAELQAAGRWEEATRVADKARARIAETTEETTEFFRQVSFFHLTAHKLALARAEAASDENAIAEPEAAAAVNSLRQYVLSGWRGANWLRTDSGTEPLRQRADFKELAVWLDELGLADATARNAIATRAEKLAARQKILTTLEALAGPLPSARFVRRSLAQARQDLAQALLDAGRVHDARLAFDAALAVRQTLVEESPSNEQLRADLAESQAAAGDLFAAAGKLADAVKTWDKALATLEEGLKKNPNSIPFQTALSYRLLHVADEYGQVGLWDRTTKNHRRAFEVQLPTKFAYWYHFGVLLAAADDSKGLQSLATRAVVPLAVEKDNLQFVFLSIVFLSTPEVASRHPEALQQIAAKSKFAEWDWGNWCKGLAYVRLGQAEKGAPFLEQVKDPLQKLPALAIALQQMGRTQAAREALQQADEHADHLLRGGLLADSLKRPDSWWPDWLLYHTLRREAHQAIHGKPMPESPYARLFRGRVLHALDERAKAEAEFAAAVELRPDDAEVWLTRGRIFAGMGQKDRMAADLLQAQQLKGGDPKMWVETGRTLAERGETKQADAAFVRASDLSKGELGRFLEAGWWAVGPYPEPFDLACPPEFNPDPSKPVAAVGDKRDLKWQTYPTEPQSGGVGLGPIHGGAKNVTVYGLNHVYADRDRTATLHLQSHGDARLWVNGRLVFDGFAAWKLPTDQPVPIAVTLHAGRNTLLIRTRPTGTTDGFLCRFQDHPFERADVDKAEDDYARLVKEFPDQPRLWIDRGRRLGELKHWEETAKAFAKAAELAPKDVQVWQERGRAYAGLGKWDEAAADFAQALDLGPASTTVPTYYAWWTQRHGIDDAVLRHPEVYDRLTRLRPKDVALVARKVNDLITRGQYQEAATHQARVVALVPDNDGARQILALLRLAAGDRDGHRTICRELLPRLQNSTDPGAIEPMAIVSLLTPDVGVARGTIEQWSLVTSKDPKTIELAHVLAEYRLGNYERVVEAAARFSKDGKGYQFAGLRAVQAASLAKLGKYAEATDALRKAREELDKLPRPGRIEPPERFNWWETLRAEALIREAEKFLATAPAQVTQGGVSAQEQAARRERKTQAEKIAAQEALAQIRFDIGQKKEAEMEIRAVLAEREKIAADEAGNADYQTDLAFTRLRLGQFLAAAGHLDDALKEAENGLAFLEEHAAAQPKKVRLLDRAALAVQAIGDLHDRASLDKLEPKWTALKPLAVKSEGGTTLTLQPDDSVLASGENPDKDLYVIDVEVQGPIGAIRLEAIPDASMPNGGCGRGAGNFVLTDFRVIAGENVVVWTQAYADFSQEDSSEKHPIAFAIDADESTGWAIWPREAERHWAVFMPSRPIATAGKTHLTIRLAFRSKHPHHTLGRFRLSVVGETDMVRQTDWFLAASTPLAKVGAAYLALGNAKRATGCLTKATAADDPKSGPADYLILALAHAKLKEMDRAKKAVGKAAELLKPTGAEATLRPLLREVLLAMGMNHPEAKELITAAAAGDPPAPLNEAIKQNPDKAEGYRDRGNWFGERGRWKEAIADHTVAFRLDPDTHTGMRLGLLLIQTGDVAGYREHCQAMLKRWALTKNMMEADQTYKTVILVPNFKADARQLAGLAEVALSGDKNGDWYEWFLFAKGLHDYRTGKYADALATCRESRRRAPEGKGDSQALASLNLAIEAMALHRSGDRAGAKRALTEAQSHVDIHVPGVDADGWYEWLAARILYREAEGLIAGKKAELPK